MDRQTNQQRDRDRERQRDRDRERQRETETENYCHTLTLTHIQQHVNYHSIEETSRLAFDTFSIAQLHVRIFL